MTGIISLLLTLLFSFGSAEGGDCRCISEQFGRTLTRPALPTYVLTMNLVLFGMRDGVCYEAPNCDDAAPADCEFDYFVLAIARRPEYIPEIRVDEGQNGQFKWDWVTVAEGQETRLFFYKGTLKVDCGHMGQVKVFIKAGDDYGWTTASSFLVKCYNCSN